MGVRRVAPAHCFGCRWKGPNALSHCCNTHTHARIHTRTRVNTLPAIPRAVVCLCKACMLAALQHHSRRALPSRGAHTCSGPALGWRGRWSPPRHRSPEDQRAAVTLVMISQSRAHKSWARSYLQGFLPCPPWTPQRQRGRGGRGVLQPPVSSALPGCRPALFAGRLSVPFHWGQLCCSSCTCSGGSQHA